MIDWYYIENIMDGRIEMYATQYQAQNAMEQKPYGGEEWLSPQPVVDEEDEVSDG